MILMYHKVSPDAPTLWWVTADDFRRQMLELRNRRVVHLDDYDPADPAHVVITFDGVYENVLHFAAPVLQDLGYPFEMFVTGDYVGRDNAFDKSEPPASFASQETLSRLIKMGGRLQWHGNAHLDLGGIDDINTIAAELEIPEPLRRLDAQGFRWFAYPHGTFNDTVLRAVRTRFSGALSCHQGNGQERWQLNRVTVTNDTSFRPATVSVVVACHNYGSYLVEAVESVLRQTLPAQEVLISDDASTDDTPVIMEMLARKYGGRLRLHRNPVNLGIVRHFNQAIRMTGGDYVCILGADNRFRSDYLEHTVGALDTRPRAAIAYTDFALFGPRAPLVTKAMQENWQVDVVGGELFVVRFPDFSPQTAGLLDRHINFMHGSSLFRRTAFEAVGGYREQGGVAEDYDLFTRMVRAGHEAVRCPLPLLEYRQHSRDQANIRLSSEAELQAYREAYRALQQEITRIRSSWSWKLATPLRVAEHQLRRLVAHCRRNRHD